MAKKDELLKNKNNETETVSDDKSLDKKEVEELQEELSSIFNEDYDENEEDEEWEEAHESFPLFPFLGRRERYGKDLDSDEEKKAKKKKFPWSKKAKETEETTEEKTENAETPDEEKEEIVKETVETEIVEEKEEINPVKEDEENTVDETINEIPEIEEQEEIVEEVVEEKEEVIEELPPFEEEEEVVEELPPFEEEEEIVEELAPSEEPLIFEDDEDADEFPPAEKIPSVVTNETENPVETVVVTEEKTDIKPVEQKMVKEDKEEETIPQNESEPLTKKDHLTFILALVALGLAIAFVCVKFFVPMNNNGEESPENTTEISAELSEIQVARQGTNDKYVQSDLENVYYSFSAENEVKYYEYENNTMKPLQVTGTVNSQVSMDNNTLPVSINYVKTGAGVFGITIFRSEDNPGSTIHNVITFKLINLPEKHNAEGKALLLAVANSESASRKYNLWTDSFVVDLNTGATTRFLTADENGDSYSVAYSVLTNSACATDGEMIPFFTTREYGEGSGKKDLFVKNGENESLFATDVYGEYIYADKDVIAYLKATETGFNVVKKEDTKEEKVVFSLYGSFSADYLYHQEYILNKLSGNLYNAKTGEEIALAGYKMSNAEMMSVSPDGRYLVVLGTVNSVADYQVHIFDLKKNDYAKYEDMNFSQHYNLAFADNTKVMYVSVDPNQGYEHVILDVSKAF